MSARYWRGSSYKCVGGLATVYVLCTCTVRNTNTLCIQRYSVISVISLVHLSESLTRDMYSFNTADGGKNYY